MATLPVATRNAALNAVAPMVDEAGSPGHLLIQNSGGTTLVSIPFLKPAFAAASGGSTSLAGGNSISGTVATAGTASQSQIVDSAGTVIMSGTVGTTGAEINISSVTLSVNDTVTITSLNIVQAAS